MDLAVHALVTFFSGIQHFDPWRLPRLPGHFYGGAVTIFKEVELCCDTVRNNFTCPYDSKIYAPSARQAREEAKAIGWIRGNLGAGVWVDICNQCKGDM